MSAGFRYSITESLKNGIDFYGLVYKTASIDLISITSDTQIISKKIAYANTSISCNSYSVNLGTRIRSISSNISITSDISISAIEILYSNTSISITSNASIVTKKIAKAQNDTTNGELNIQIIAKKIAYSSSNIQITSQTNFVAKKIAKATTTINTNLDTSFVARRLRQVSSSINAFTIIVTVADEILFAHINIPITTSVLINCIKFASNGNIDTSQYRNLFVLDNKPLTNQGRAFSSDQSMVFIENKNWNSSKSRYYKRSTSAGRNSFNLTWTFLPNSRYQTIDNRYARDYIKELAGDPDVHTLKVINNDENNTTPYTETSYNVFVKDYSETLVRRDLQNDVYYWDCTLTLEEV